MNGKGKELLIEHKVQQWFLCFSDDKFSVNHQQNNNLPILVFICQPTIWAEALVSKTNKLLDCIDFFING